MGHCERMFASERDKAYHDREWGVPVHDDRQMFEHLSLECLQCGLSWGLMLQKRAIFRRCFADFDFDAIAAYTEEDVQRVLHTPGMLRAERKVRAIVNNARCYQKIRAEFGSFCDYLWAYTGGKTLLYDGHAEGRIPVCNGLSQRIARDLKKRGFQYVGAVTVYSHLQACGVINDHAGDCPRYRAVNAAGQTAHLPPDEEVGQAGGAAPPTRRAPAVKP